MHPLYDRSCENTKQSKTEYSEEGTERLIFDEIHQQECQGVLECCRELPLDFGKKSRRNLHLTTVSQLMVLHKSKIYCSEKYIKCICIYACIYNPAMTKEFERYIIIQIMWTSCCLSVPSFPIVFSPEDSCNAIN